MNDASIKQILTTVAGDCIREAIAELPETDLVVIARNEVIKKAKAWSLAWQMDGGPQTQSRAERDSAEAELLGAVASLEAREEVAVNLQQCMKDTEHLQEIGK